MKQLYKPSYVCLLIAVAAVAYGYRPPERGPSVEIQNASGEVQLQNSKNGSAIFQASTVAPGQPVTGTVQLSNSGSGSGDLDLSQADLVDTPGIGGLGALSTLMQLTVQDVTNPGSPVSVYSGAPSALGTRALGSLAPGQTRTYAFTASLPVGVGNALAGAAMSLRYVWKLTGEEGGSGGGGGNNGGGQTKPGGSIAGGGGAGGGALSRMPVSVKVNVKKTMKNGVVAVTVKCGEACRMNAYAAAKGKPAVRTRRKAGRVKVAGKKATIKLKLSKKALRALKKRLKRKKSVPLYVTVKAQDPRGSWKTVTKSGKVKRPKRR